MDRVTEKVVNKENGRKTLRKQTKRRVDVPTCFNLLHGAEGAVAGLIVGCYCDVVRRPTLHIAHHTVMLFGLADADVTLAVCYGSLEVREVTRGFPGHVKDSRRTV